MSACRPTSKPLYRTLTAVGRGHILYMSSVGLVVGGHGDGWERVAPQPSPRRLSHSSKEILENATAILSSGGWAQRLCGLSSGANAEPAEGGLARLAIERLAGPAGVTQPNAAAEAPARARCRRIGD